MKEGGAGSIKHRKAAKRLPLFSGNSRTVEFDSRSYDTSSSAVYVVMMFFIYYRLKYRLIDLPRYIAGTRGVFFYSRQKKSGIIMCKAPGIIQFSFPRDFD